MLTTHFKSLFITLSILIFLQGCAAAVIGGAGAGGYYVGKDKRDFGTIMDDAGITAGVNSKLLGAKGVSTFDINVDTDNGIVTLNGDVPSSKIKNKVISLAKQVKGVKKVISKLKIVP